MIELKGISKSWRGFTLSVEGLSIRDGEYLVILGPTGAGKTMLLEMIAGFHTPDAGVVLKSGGDITHMPPEKRNIGFVYQDYLLFPNLSVQKNVEFGPAVCGLDKKDEVSAIMDSLNIAHFANRYPAKLSGGERQRVALARAIVTGPDVLLLDEPLSALDVNLRNSVRKKLRQLHSDMGLTVVHVTHDHDEASMLADRIAIMMDGRIVQVGTHADVFNRPVNRAVAEFVGMGNMFEATVVGCGSDGMLVVGTGAGDVQVHMSGDEDNRFTKGMPVCACVRPEDVCVCTTKDCACHVEADANVNVGTNVFCGVVDEVEYRGAQYDVWVDCGGVVMHAHVAKREIENMEIEVGSEVAVSFGAKNVHIIR